MTLQQALNAFIAQHNRTDFSVEAIELFNEYLSAAGIGSSDKLSLSALRDFIARSYVEMASLAPADKKIPAPGLLLASIGDFLAWAYERADLKIEGECAGLLSELQESLSRALEINKALSKHYSARGGAFGFPEFLTSFDQGGHSQYDIGEPGCEASAVEGYFLIERVEDARVQALEIISDRRVWPILFPEEAAKLVLAGFIINLEIIRADDKWQITGCGFAFPPVALEILSGE